MPERAIVFGAAGTIGSAICEQLEADSVTVVRATRSGVEVTGWVCTSHADWPDRLPQQGLSRAVWAQGANAEGSILDAGPDQLHELLEANVEYVVRTVRSLLDARALSTHARLVIVSSVWQKTARANKLAYATSKAAVGGLVRSLAADLGPLGISVNAVLPGPVDGPMTRAFLSPERIERLERSTPLQRLVSANEVARACAWLSSPDSRGVNAEFLTVDGGWSGVRDV